MLEGLVKPKETKTPAQEPPEKEKAPEKTDSRDEEITELKEMIKVQTKALEDMKKTVFNPEYIKAVKGNPPAAPVVPDEKPNLEEMTDAERTEHIIKTMGGVIDTKIGELRAENQALRARQTIFEVKTRHPDFDDFVEPIKEVYKETPTIHPEKAYLLAKFGSAEAQERFAKFEAAEKEEVKKAEEQSITPSSPGAKILEEVKDLDPEAQLDRIYDATVGGEKKE